MATPHTQNRNTNDPRQQDRKLNDSRADSAMDNRPQGTPGNRDNAPAGKTSGPQQRKDRDQQDASAGRKLTTEDKLGQDETNIGEPDVQDGKRQAHGRATNATAGIDDEDVDIDHPGKSADKKGMPKPGGAKSEHGGCGCG